MLYLIFHCLKFKRFLSSFGYNETLDLIKDCFSINIWEASLEFYWICFYFDLNGFNMTEVYLFQLLFAKINLIELAISFNGMSFPKFV